MNNEVLLESVGYLFAKICKRRRNKANAMLAEFGIHAGQDVLLYYLSMKDGQTVSQLVAEINVQHATISNMIDRMAANKLVSKVKDKHDMRVSRIFLTEKGKEALVHVKQVWETLEIQSLKGLSDEEKEILKKLLRRVFFNFDNEQSKNH